MENSILVLGRGRNWGKGGQKKRGLPPLLWTPGSQPSCVWIFLKKLVLVFPSVRFSAPQTFLICPHWPFSSLFSLLYSWEVLCGIPVFSLSLVLSQVPYEESSLIELLLVSVWMRHNVSITLTSTKESAFSKEDTWIPDCWGFKLSNKAKWVDATVEELLWAEACGLRLPTLLLSPGR